MCPECETKIKNVSQLKPDEERRARVKDYVDEMVQSSKEGAEEGETVEDDKETKEKSSEPLTRTDSQTTGAESSKPAEADSTQAQPSMPMMNPMLLQQNIMQMMMMLSNPQLPPPMRMQLQMRVQQAQMMLMTMANQAQINQNGKRTNEEEDGGRKKSRT